ncbi:MAG: hypothetical protein HQ483_07445 [Rhodospirillales bacterium]|nr:hypothetical protein [Rhodospirillales bacterium]
MNKVYVLKIDDDPIYGPVFLGAVVSKSPFAAKLKLISEFKAETGEAPENAELLEFKIAE